MLPKPPLLPNRGKPRSYVVKNSLSLRGAGGGGQVRTPLASDSCQSSATEPPITPGPSETKCPPHWGCELSSLAAPPLASFSFNKSCYSFLVSCSVLCLGPHEPESNSLKTPPSPNSTTDAQKKGTCHLLGFGASAICSVVRQNSHPSLLSQTLQVSVSPGGKLEE